jgi:hypothetical protein
LALFAAVSQLPEHHGAGTNLDEAVESEPSECY